MNNSIEAVNQNASVEFKKYSTSSLPNNQIVLAGMLMQASDTLSEIVHQSKQANSTMIDDPSIRNCIYLEIVYTLTMQNNLNNG